ncbi:MAG: metalloregulator ArsR/SmtB family transcription factor [Burkholderiaceae bacterium]|nr:metalloregulator ArsR/SmtB family transcription factor [Burkholderiaceae bacterium]
MKDLNQTARVLSALGHEARLSLFRLLVRAGDGGLNVGDLRTHLGIPATTLGHHLSALVEVGLVQQERCGREVINRVNYPAVRAVADFLTAECCRGVDKAEEGAAC